MDFQNLLKTLSNFLGGANNISGNQQQQNKVNERNENAPQNANYSNEQQSNAYKNINENQYNPTHNNLSPTYQNSNFPPPLNYSPYKNNESSNFEEQNIYPQGLPNNTIKQPNEQANVNVNSLENSLNNNNFQGLINQFLGNPQMINLLKNFLTQNTSSNGGTNSIASMLSSILGGKNTKNSQKTIHNNESLNSIEDDYIDINSLIKIDDT